MVIVQDTFLHMPLIIASSPSFVPTKNLESMLSDTHVPHTMSCGFFVCFVHVLKEFLAIYEAVVLKHLLRFRITFPKILCCAVYVKFHNSNKWHTSAAT